MPDTTLKQTEVPTPPRGLGMAFVGLMFVMMLASLDQTIVATALPRIVSDLGAATQLSWVVTAYVLATTCTMPLYGKLSDQHGRRVVLFAAIFIFLTGSALCGLAQSMPELIFFRALQGLGAGGLVPLVQVTVSDLVSPRERGRYQGLFTATFAASSVTGPLLGGVITQILSWHWIFYINLPVGVAAMAMIAIGIPKHGDILRREIDYPGAVLLAAATTCLLLVLSLGGSPFPWDSPQLIGTGLGGLLLFAFFYLWERKAMEPVLPLQFFSNPVFTISAFGVGLTFMAIMGAGVFTPLFFQLVLGIPAAQSGMLTGAMTIGIMTTSIFGGRWVSRSGRYKPPPVLGLALAASAYLGLGWAALSGRSVFVVEPILVVMGMGFGLIMGNLTVATQNSVEARDRGAATSALAFARSVGGTIGIALSGAIMAGSLRSRLEDSRLAGTTGTNPDALLDEGIRQLVLLPPAARDVLVGIYRHGIGLAFISGAVPVAMAFVVVLFLPELALQSGLARGGRQEPAPPSSESASPMPALGE